jgi:hypothetical protein
MAGYVPPSAGKVDGNTKTAIADGIGVIVVRAACTVENPVTDAVIVVVPDVSVE